MIKLLKLQIKILIISTLFIFLISKSNGVENKIIFKIDNEIITSVDLLNEIEYLKILNDELNSLPGSKIYEIAKKSLIKQKIKRLETRKFYKNLDNKNDYSEILLKEFIKKANLKSKQELYKILETKNIEENDIVEKIKNEILWNQLIVNKFKKKIQINREKIRNEVLQNNIQKEYHLSEIVFKLDNESLDEKYKKIKKEININGFINTASIYSISDTAKEGGKIGWIKLNSLNEELKEEIQKLSKNQFTKPIIIPGGFLILRVDDKKEYTKIENIELEIENISKLIANKQLNQFSNIYYEKIKKEFQINEY